MKFRIKLITAGVFASTSPLLPYIAQAAEVGPIRVTDPTGKTSISLNPGDLVALTADGRVSQSAIYVAGAGNSLHAESNVIYATTSNAINPAGIRAVDGGTINLSNSSVTTQGGSQGHALWASGTGSTIITFNTHLKNIDGVQSYLVAAESGGKVVLQGGTIETSAQNIAVRALGDQTLVSMKDLSITLENSTNGSINANAGARVELDNVQIKVKNGAGTVIQDQGTVLSMKNSSITVQSGQGVVLNENSTFHMTGGTVQATSPAIHVHRNSQATIRDATLISGNGTGIYLNGNDASADLNNVSIQTLDTGAWLQTADTHLNANQLTIRSGNAGIGNLAGEAVLIDSAITTLNKDGHGLYVSREIDGSKASTRAVNTTIKTEGDSAVGALVRSSDASITLESSTVETAGKDAHGLSASGNGASLNANNTSVSTTGDNAAGLSTSNNATAKLNVIQISTTGDNAAGLLADNNAVTTLDDTQVSTRGNNAAGLATSNNAITKLNVAQISTTGDNAAGLSASDSAVTTLNATQVSTLGDNAAGLSASDNAITKLSDTQISTRGKNADAIRSSATISGASNEISLTNSRIDTNDGAGMVFEGGKHQITLGDTTITARAAGRTEGGVLLRTANSGSAGAPETEQVQLDAKNSLLFGDVIARSGAVNLNLEQGSSFNGAVQQADKGSVERLALDNRSVWNVRDSSTLGTLDNRGIVRFGQTTAGAYQTLTARNYTGDGLLVMRTQLGDDRASNDRIVIDGGNASGGSTVRIINSKMNGARTKQEVRIVETTNGATTTSDAIHLDTSSSGFRQGTDTIAFNGYDYSLLQGGVGRQANDWHLTARNRANNLLNISPETGAYAGNQRAAMNLFALSMNDRSAGLNAKGERGIWTRISGRRDHGLHMVDGAVDIRTDSTMLQMGGDLIRLPISTGALYVGAMGGYGDVRTRSTSALQLPTQNIAIDANGKVSGYALGIYLTTYANDATRLGTYADTWLQYGHYKNSISSNLGATNYNSDVWSASLEAGHALKPYGVDSSLRDIVITPRMQLTYGRYQAKDATLNDILMQSGRDNIAHSRLGLRVQQHDQASQATTLPYVETNWVRRLTGKQSVQMGNNLLDMASTKNAWELKLGFDSHVSQKLKLSAQALTLFSGQERGYSAMFNVDYRW